MNPNLFSAGELAAVSIATDMMTSLLDTTQALSWPLGSTYRAMRSHRDFWLSQATTLFSNNRVYSAHVPLTEGEDQLRQLGYDQTLGEQVDLRVTAYGVAKTVLRKTLSIETDLEFNNTPVFREPGSLLHKVPLHTTADGWADSYAGRFMLARNLGLNKRVVTALRQTPDVLFDSEVNQPGTTRSIPGWIDRLGQIIRKDPSIDSGPYNNEQPESET